MQTLTQDFSVSFEYPVYFGEDLLSTDNQTLADLFTEAERADRPKVLAILDQGLVDAQPAVLDRLREYANHYSNTFELIAEPHLVPGGEAAKNDPTLVDEIHELIYEGGLCRHSYVVVIGGGAVLDLGGYAAGTAHRGIRLVRMPSTVLSQNDSGVGVKNGINAFGTKNFLGTFEPPYAVLNDYEFLRTLDDRDWRSGISEAVKVALLKDPEFFTFLEAHVRDIAPPQRDQDHMKHLVYRCAELHLEHIATSGDPFEKGSSRPLDFGHWAAHKLEQFTDYELRHGEAVAVGLALDCTYAHVANDLPADRLERILGVLEGAGYPLYVPELETQVGDPDHPDSIFQGLSEFREHLGGELTILLLEDIGQPVEVNTVDYDRYREAMSRLRIRTAEDQHRTVTG